MKYCKLARYSQMLVDPIKSIPWNPMPPFYYWFSCGFPMIICLVILREETWSYLSQIRLEERTSPDTTAIVLGQFHHDLTLRPHHRWWLVRESSPNGVISGQWIMVIYPDSCLKLYSCVTLWFEHGHLEWIYVLNMLIMHSYVRVPEGNYTMLCYTILKYTEYI